MSTESDIAAYKRRKQMEKAIAIWRATHDVSKMEIAKESKFVQDLRRHIKRKWEVEE